MMVQTACVVVVGGAILPMLQSANAFLKPMSLLHTKSSSLHYDTSTFLSSSNANANTNNNYNNELDSILGEGHHLQNSIHSIRKSVVLPDTSAIVDVAAAASLPLPSQPHLYTDEGDELFGGGVDAEEDYLEDYSSSSSAAPPTAEQQQTARAPRMGTTRKFLGMRFTSSGYTFRELLDQKDYNGVLTQYFVPIAALGVGAVWGTNQLLKKYNEKMEDVLTSYANEMVFHDGDFEEMQMCFKDYKTKLTTLGPSRNDAMLKRYLELYAKKKTVSPQAVSSLSYVFSMYKLSEEKAAKLLVEVSQNMKDKVASTGKLLFFGRRILRSPEGQSALQPIKEMLVSNYKKGGDMIVENAQKSMGEAAYRATVVAAGKNQTTLTVGWEVLGLDQSTAETIFNEVSNTGFKSKREELYGGVRQKYDDKGRKLDDEGDIIDPEEAKEALEEKETGGMGSVYECETCGYTLFPAKGREFKFFPDGFVCPECGSPKDQFKEKGGN